MDPIQQSILAQAEALARDVHSRQVDKGGNPYIDHVYAVVSAMAPVDFAGRVVAWLHDVWEDHPDVRRHQVVERFLPWRLLQALDAITRRPGEEYTDYIGRVMRDPVARRVKVADLMNNLDLRRLNRHPCPNDLMRCARYATAMADLMSAADAEAMSRPMIDPKILASDELKIRDDLRYQHAIAPNWGLSC